jgi:phosphatidylserine decarboxylase
MEAYPLILAILFVLILLAGGGLYWRYVWFFRNPSRTTPPTQGILSPADGTVVYVKKVQPFEEVVVIKQGVKAKVEDILWEDVSSPKLVIGIFMSPFDVHYNRAPVTGQVDFVRHYPAKGKNLHMGSMHLRTVLNWAPYYRNSVHIIQNERKVTRISGHYKTGPLPCYVVQIAGGSVNGIDSYVQAGDSVERGAIFGMIRIGSQVDLVMPWREELAPLIRPGDKVKAGETILVD